MTIPTLQIPDRLYFKIGDVAELIGVKPYVLRYWESEFPMIKPQKSQTGQRVYRRADVETVMMIRHLLYNERYSIEGARKRIKELRKLTAEGKNGGVAEVATAASASELAEAAAPLASTPKTPPSTLSDAKKEELHQLLHDVQNFANTTIDRLFQL